MGPRARRSSPRATQTRGPVAGTTRLDRRHEPGRAQPTRTGHVAKQVLLVIGVAQVITRALSRLDEMALREETQTLLRGLDTLAAGLPIGSSVRSRSWSTSIEMRRRRSDAACSRPHAPGARRLATPATRAPRSAARENCGPDRLRLQRVSHQHPGGNERSLPRSDVPQGAAPSLRTSTSRVAEPSARPVCSP